MEKFDLIIIGGGPAGSACAIKLANSGLRIALIDKATFPRDKVCGDGLSIDVINQLPMLSKELADSFQSFPNKHYSNGLRLFSPDTTFLDIPFYYKKKKSCGYVSPRLHFDNLLFQHAKSYPGIKTFENTSVTNVLLQDNRVVVETADATMEAQMILGADGAHSIVAKKLANQKIKKEHFCAGLRMYYEGIPAFDDNNYIELYFFKDILPGYVWIFPLEGNRANVGIGVLSSEVSKKKMNIKEKLQHLIETDPKLKERFKNAKPLETVKGFGLPLGSAKRKISGERYLLMGDAAALIDPFSGEGIGNAIRSGRVAAEHVLQCFEQKNFSSSFNKAYDKEIYKRMWNEFKISRTLQQIVRYPRAFSFVIRQANRSKYLHQFLIDAISDIEKKRKILWKPMFYLRMLFK